jgi:hypothetical protein
MYKLRKLKTNDIYKMSKILKKMNLKFNVNDKTQEQLGAEMIQSIIENLYMAQEEVNDFLGGLVGMSGEDFGELDIEESQKIIKQFKEIPQLANFFKLAGQLTR